MEAASGLNLTYFFEQWLYKPGMLKCSATWEYNPKKKELKLLVNQTQTNGTLFKMPVQVAIYLPNQPKPLVKTIQINEKENVFTTSVESQPEKILLDPDSWVLMDAEIKKK